MNSRPPIPDVRLIEDIPETDDELLERLAELSYFEYEQVRSAQAKILGIRVSALDVYVSEKRQIVNPEVESNSIIETLEPWDKPVDSSWIVTEIKKQINAYCILPEEYLAPIVAWVIGTYCFNAFRIFPKLCIYSPQKRCGKSTLMEVLDALSFSALMASNVSPAVIFRIIESYQPTLLLDEADTWLVGQHANDEMRGIINSGHTKKTAVVLRCDGDKNEPKAFSTWSPMAIGMIGKPQPTIEDRSIMISMKRKLKGEFVSKLPVDYSDTCLILRRAILRWANDHIDTIKCKRLRKDT